MGRLSSFLSFGFLLVSVQRCFGQARFDTCSQIQDCIIYSETGCDNDGERHVCIRWEDTDACGELDSGSGAETSLEVCRMNEFPVGTRDSIMVGETYCADVAGGSMYAFGIISEASTNNPFSGTILISGYPNGVVQCEGFVNHCAPNGQIDFRLTFMVSACPTTTTSAVTTTTVTTTTQQGCVCPPWSNWSGCSATCGPTAMRTRIRDACTPTCSPTPTQSETGLCPGVPANCPIDGRYSQWTQWTTCPVTCGGGTQRRSRTCTMPSPQFGGADCVGQTSEDRLCSTGACPNTGGANARTSRVGGRRRNRGTRGGGQGGGGRQNGGRRGGGRRGGGRRGGGRRSGGQRGGGRRGGGRRRS